MPTVIAHHDVNDTNHWLASSKREEFFGPLGVTSIRTFVDPQNPTQIKIGRRLAIKILNAAKKEAGVLTTDFFGFDTSDDHYGLQGHGGLSEMGDAVLGLLESRPDAPKTSWVAVRNVSDPQIKSEGTISAQANAAAQIYKAFGRWSTVCSAITCCSLIAAL